MTSTATQADLSSRETRLRQPITGVEALVLVGAVAATLFLFPRWISFAYRTVSGLDGYAWFFAFAFLGMGVAGFALPFAAMAITPWRFKLVAGVLSQFVLVYWGGRMLVEMIPAGFWPVAGELARFAFLQGGALGALLVWGRLREKRLEGATPFPSHASDGEQVKPPRSPVLVQIIALASIPAIYVGILAGALVTVGIGILLTILISEANRVPTLLVAAAYLAPIAALLGAVYALLRAIVPPAPTELAVPLPREAAPHLWELVGEVCRTLGTREPRHVVVHMAPTFFVMQGRLKVYDKSKIRGRILAVGLPALRELGRRELKSILTHEFAHFSGGDTIYSAIGSRVYTGLGAAAHAIRSGSGLGGRFGPVIYFVQIPALQYMLSYYRYLRSLDASISRRRELRADWYAANHYGREAFISGLKKVVGIGMHFNDAIKSLRFTDPRDLYRAYAEYLDRNPGAYTDLLQKSLEQGETEFSSHPRLKVRIEAASLVPYSSSHGIENHGSMDTMIAELAPAERILAAVLGAAVLRFQEQERLAAEGDEEDDAEEWDGSLDDDE